MYITSYSIRIVLLSRYVNIYDTMAPMSVIEFRVGDMTDYWAPGSIVGILSNLRTGMITQIYSCTDWDDSDDM